MKKMNKKGFTLIELLAVIVVLAIIMVIATQQVNNTIKKSRANTYADSVMSVKKSLQTVCATDGSITNDGIKESVEYSDIEISMTKDSPEVTIKPTGDGKYNNMDTDTLKGALSSSYTIRDTTVTFDADCNASESISEQ